MKKPLKIFLGNLAGSLYEQKTKRDDLKKLLKLKKHIMELCEDNLSIIEYIQNSIDSVEQFDEYLMDDLCIIDSSILNIWNQIVACKNNLIGCLNKDVTLNGATITLKDYYQKIYDDYAQDCLNINDDILIANKVIIDISNIGIDDLLDTDSLNILKNTANKLNDLIDLLNNKIDNVYDQNIEIRFNVHTNYIGEKIDPIIVKLKQEFNLYEHLHNHFGESFETDFDDIEYSFINDGINIPLSDEDTYVLYDLIKENNNNEEENILFLKDDNGNYYINVELYISYKGNITLIPSVNILCKQVTNTIEIESKEFAYDSDINLSNIVSGISCTINDIEINERIKYTYKLSNNQSGEISNSDSTIINIETLNSNDSPIIYKTTIDDNIVWCVDILFEGKLNSVIHVSFNVDAKNWKLSDNEEITVNNITVDYYDDFNLYDYLNDQINIFDKCVTLYQIGNRRYIPINTNKVINIYNLDSVDKPIFTAGLDDDNNIIFNLDAITINITYIGDIIVKFNVNENEFISNIPDSAPISLESDDDGNNKYKINLTQHLIDNDLINESYVIKYNDEIISDTDNEKEYIINSNDILNYDKLLDQMYINLTLSVEPNSDILFNITIELKKDFESTSNTFNETNITYLDYDMIRSLVNDIQDEDIISIEYKHNSSDETYEQFLTTTKLTKSDLEIDENDHTNIYINVNTKIFSAVINVTRKTETPETIVVNVNDISSFNLNKYIPYILDEMEYIENLLYSYDNLTFTEFSSTERLDITYSNIAQYLDDSRTLTIYINESFISIDLWFTNIDNNNQMQTRKNVTYGTQYVIDTNDRDFNYNSNQPIVYKYDKDNPSTVDIRTPIDLNYHTLPQMNIKTVSSKQYYEIILYYSLPA